jgi:hypothetical protein
MTHSNCTYTIAPMSDSVPEQCGKPAIRQVLLANEQQTEILYCFQHWNQVKDLPAIKEATILDLVEEMC